MMTKNGGDEQENMDDKEEQGPEDDTLDKTKEKRRNMKTPRQRQKNKLVWTIVLSIQMRMTT